METTLVLLKPSTISRGLSGAVLDRFCKKGLIIAGIKMLQLTPEILSEHYSHLKEKPFFPVLCESMMRTPIIALALRGVDAVEVVRAMTGVTNCRKAQPGTIRGDFGMSGQENIIHTSDSVESAKVELNRFFRPDEIFDYSPVTLPAIYGQDEI